jgi:hypothetical protein
VFLTSEQLLTVRSVAETSWLWPVALVPTRLKLGVLDVRTSKAGDIGVFEPEGSVGSFDDALSSAAQVSPDRKLAVDRYMNLWKVPP